MFSAFRALVASASRPLNVDEGHLRVHVEESQLEAASAACPVCGLGPRQARVKVQDGPEVWFAACGHCSACSASRMPTEAFLESYYRDYFADGGVRVSFQQYERFYRRMQRVGALPYHVVGECRILDFGGGDGRMALHIAQRLIDEGVIERACVTLVDFSAPAEPASEQVGVVKAQLEEVGGASQDMVVASGVLEHIPDLHDALRQVVRVMRPGARMYARAPYAMPMKRVFSDYDLQFPMHVHDLGPGFWRKWCDEDRGVRLRLSQPSIVKYPFAAMPLHALAAGLMKLPAHVQVRLPLLRELPLLWRFVGGWEVVVERDQ